MHPGYIAYPLAVLDPRFFEMHSWHLLEIAPGRQKDRVCRDVIQTRPLDRAVLSIPTGSDLALNRVTAGASQINDEHAHANSARLCCTQKYFQNASIRDVAARRRIVHVLCKSTTSQNYSAGRRSTKNTVFYRYLAWCRPRETVCVP